MLMDYPYDIDLEGKEDSKKEPKTSIKYDDLESFFKSKPTSVSKIIGASRVVESWDTSPSPDDDHLTPLGDNIAIVDFDMKPPAVPLKESEVANDSSFDSEQKTDDSQSGNRGQKVSKKKKMKPVNIDFQYANPPNPGCSSSVEFVGMVSSEPVPESAKVDYWTTQPRVPPQRRSRSPPAPPPGFDSVERNWYKENAPGLPNGKFANDDVVDGENDNWTIAGGSQARNNLKKKMKDNSRSGSQNSLVRNDSFKKAGTANKFDVLKPTEPYSGSSHDSSQEDIRGMQFGPHTNGKFEEPRADSKGLVVNSSQTDSAVSVVEQERTKVMQAEYIEAVRLLNLEREKHRIVINERNQLDQTLVGLQLRISQLQSQNNALQNSANDANLRVALETCKKQLAAKEDELNEMTDWLVKSQTSEAKAKEDASRLEQEKKKLEDLQAKMLTELKVIDNGWISYCNMFKSTLLDVDCTRDHITRLLEQLNEMSDVGTVNADGIIANVGALFMAYNEISDKTRHNEKELVHLICRLRQQARDGLPFTQLESIQASEIVCKIRPILEGHLSGVSRSPMQDVPSHAPPMAPPPGTAPLPGIHVPAGLNTFGVIGSGRQAPGMPAQAQAAQHTQLSLPQLNFAQLNVSPPGFAASQAPPQGVSVPSPRARPDNLVPAAAPPQTLAQKPPPVVHNSAPPEQMLNPHAQSFVPPNVAPVPQKQQNFAPAVNSFAPAKSAAGSVSPADILPQTQRMATPVLGDEMPRSLPPSVQKSDNSRSSSRVSNTSASVYNTANNTQDNTPSRNQTLTPLSPSSSNNSLFVKAPAGSATAMFKETFVEFCNALQLPIPDDATFKVCKKQSADARRQTYGSLKRPGVPPEQDIRDMAYEAGEIYVQMRPTPAPVPPSQPVGVEADVGVMHVVDIGEHGQLYINDEICSLCDQVLVNDKVDTDIYQCNNCANNNTRTYVHRTCLEGYKTNAEAQCTGCYAYL